MSTLKVETIQDTNGANPSTAEQMSKGRAKAWVNFDGKFNTSPFTTANGGIRSAFNVSSVTDHATGQYTVHFDTDFLNTNYAAVGFVHRNGSTEGKVLCNIDTLTQQNVDSYRFMVSGTSNASDVGLTTVDVEYVFLSFFGDQ